MILLSIALSLTFHTWRLLLEIINPNNVLSNLCRYNVQCTFLLDVTTLVKRVYAAFQSLIGSEQEVCGVTVITEFHTPITGVGIRHVRAVSLHTVINS